MSERPVPDRDDEGAPASRPGWRVLEEIASQPDCWATALDRAGEADKTLPGRGERVAFVGCGTSFHIATAVAAAREAAGHGETDAFPASELPARPYDTVVAITRSGTTTEVLQALRSLSPAVRRIAITTDANLPVADVADDLLVLEYADESSVVQTRFATTVLTVARAHIGHDLAPVVSQAAEVISADIDERHLNRRHYVFLGRGWAVGVAAEAALKVREAASAWSEVYPALEYRHGPLSAATDESLVWCLGLDDHALVADIERTGATVVVGTLDPQAELVRAQRVAVATAVQRGLDPDQPRHLSRSVQLEDL